MHQKIKILLFTLALLILISIDTLIYFKKDKVEPLNESFHASMYFFDNKSFFPESVSMFKEIKPLLSQPRIFIVNQHILAAHLIANQFALAKDSKVKKVVLITQNNWNNGISPIITSKYIWETPLGNIKPAVTIADYLIDRDLVTVEEDIFHTEHGVTGIVPYIVDAFPNAEFIPLVIKDGTSDTLVDKLAEELSKLDLERTVVIASIDMSHYLPSYVADIHDRLTVESIKSFDYATLPHLDIDTAPTLRAIMKIAEKNGYKKFIQTGGVNSAKIVDDPELLSSTSYITGYFEKGNLEVSTSTVYMLFVGDIMLDRNVSKYAKINGTDNLFKNIERLFLGNDLVVGNLEGTITDNESIAEKNNKILRFTFNPTFAQVLKKFNFNVFSLANNHSSDFGSDGYKQTTDNLDRVGIKYFGSSRNDANIGTILDIKNKKICFVGYHDLYTFDSTSAIDEIKNMRDNCSYIVLFAHWGEEYKNIETDRQVKLAHDFIDAGADLVIGAHPHVIEPLEIYKDKAIFYSLGNFMFDQDFSYETKHGLAVNVEWSDDKTIFSLIPTTIEKNQARISEKEDRLNSLKIVTNNNSLLPGIVSDILNTNQFILR